MKPRIRLQTYSCVGFAGVSSTYSHVRLRRPLLAALLYVRRQIRLKCIYLHLLLMAPASALAAENEAGSGFSLAGGVIQMLASLAVVVGMILLFSYVSNRWLKTGPAASRGPRYIRLIETRYLAPKKSLMLVEVGGEYLLLGNSADGMQFIKQIDMLEEIEVVQNPDFAKVMSGALQEKLSTLVSKTSQELLRCVPMQKKSGASL